MDALYLVLCLLILVGTAFTRRRSGISYLLALCFWVSSEIATNLINSQWSSAGYVAFYPFIFLAIPALFEIEVHGQLVRLIDGAVLVLGSSTIATTFLLRSFKADFLHLLYPVCDIVILIAVLVAFVRRPINGRSLLVLSGFLIYTATDFLYLLKVTQNNYQSNSLLNYGWLLAFALITTSQFRRGIKSEEFPPIPIFYLAFSVISNSLLLAVIALDLFQFTNIVIGPALATLFAAFLRMALALKESEQSFASENLAKIDDLTGLPNRRRFISEVEIGRAHV